MSQFNTADLLITISSQSRPGAAANDDGVRDILHTLTFPHNGGAWTCYTQFSAGMRSTFGSDQGKSIALHMRNGHMAASYLLLPNPENWIEAVPVPEQREGESSGMSYTIHASLSTGISVGPNRVTPVLTFKKTDVDGIEIGEGLESLCTWISGFMSDPKQTKGLEGWLSEHATDVSTVGINGMDVRTQLRNQLIADSVSLESACKTLTDEAKSGKK